LNRRPDGKKRYSRGDADEEYTQDEVLDKFVTGQNRDCEDRDDGNEIALGREVIGNGG
jgi:hypothetical protein